MTGLNPLTIKLAMIKEDQFWWTRDGKEIKDYYQLLDEIEIQSQSLIKIMNRELFVFPSGFRIKGKQLGQLAYTPYFWYETEEEVDDYKSFIKKVKKLVIPRYKSKNKKI